MTTGTVGRKLRDRHPACAILDRLITDVRSASDALTAQETHIAGLAGNGLTNGEIGAQFSVSPHTVEWHSPAQDLQQARRHVTQAASPVRRCVTSVDCHRSAVPRCLC